MSEIPSLPANARPPTLWQALLPLLVLMVLLAAGVALFGADAAFGANQVALILAASVAALVGWRNGLSWEQLQDGIVQGVGLATGAIFILLAVGALIGTWILSGTVPTLIHYGLLILDPAWFYPAACLLCAAVAITIGSSWTTAGTIGVALMGVAGGLGMDPAITAGAVISGAYFGDKMSPLSDTTNLAPAAAGSELFAHIRHMTWTTIPSIVLAVIGFTALGWTDAGRGDVGAVADLSLQMSKHFTLGWYLLIPLLVVLLLAARRVPALPTILVGALLGALFAVIFQPDAVRTLAGGGDGGVALIKGAWMALFGGYKLESGVAAVDSLLSRGGMASMLNTVWLVLCAMAFGAVMETVGLLERLIRSVLAAAKTTGTLIAATLVTAFGTNIVTADQYISIVLPGRLYRGEYQKRGLAPVNLSRALEDGGTLTSPLVPWNTCGAYMAATLGVATFDYLPYALFNLINPILALILAFTGFKVLRLAADQVRQEQANG